MTVVRISHETNLQMSWCICGLNVALFVHSGPTICQEVV